MNQKINFLIQNIKDNKLISSEQLDEELKQSILQISDVSLFHFIVGYLEKIDSTYSNELIQDKKRLYDQQILSFDAETSLYAKDQEFINSVNQYYEKVKSNRELLNSKSSEIDNSFIPLFNEDNYFRIKSIIENGIYDNVSLEKIKENIDNQGYSNLDSSNIEKLFNALLEHYNLDSKLYEEETNISHQIESYIDRTYSSEISNDIKRSIRKKDLEHLKESIAESNTIQMREILISRFFEDVPSNFIKNLNNIINFQFEVEEQFIDKETFEIYQFILSSFSDDVSLDNLNKLYTLMLKSGIDYKSVFYDDYTRAKELSSKMMIDSTYKISPDAPYEEIDGIKCYSLIGEPFYMMVHGSTSQITDFQNGNHDGTSMSFISGERLNVYNDGIIYGFSNLVPSQFVDMYTVDTATEYDIDKPTKSLSDAVPEYHTPEKFIKHTAEDNINEILYLSGKKDTKDSYPYIEPPKPSYIVCLDEINDQSKEVAQKLGIPIVKIETKYYPKIQKNSRGHFGFLEDYETYDTIDKFTR